MSTTLVASLRAQIAKDEQRAKDAMVYDKRAEAGEFGEGGRQWLAPTRAAWKELGYGPDRVIREAAAKRALLDIVFGYEAMADAEFGCGCGKGEK
jgi:hypothetical protein